jgi:hypothetical protein
MNASITRTTNHFSPAASLAAIGVKVSRLDLFGPIRTEVQIRQKTVKHTPADKLYDAFISLLAGAHRLVVINTRLRADPALQKAFGRSSCAEQSVVQQTLDACTGENVSQMQHALNLIYRQHSRGYRHDYQAGFQLLDAFGWVSEPATGYVLPVRRIAVRCRRQDGTFAYGVLICSLSAEQVLTVLGHPRSQAADPVAVLLAYVTFYDQRGGGIEASLKGDKQGLGLTKRNKRRFEAQHLLVLLG